MWNLSPEFLEKNPTYTEFLDKIHENRLLEEVSDFRSYCHDEEKVFTDLIEPKETHLHIPDGRTFRRTIAPHPNGLIFAFEDVSDRLAATRTINEMVAVQQKILDNVDDAVIIFSSDQRLKYFNKKYQDYFGEAPNQLYSFAYDGIALASALSRKNSGNLNELIAAEDGYIGINGAFRIMPDGTNRHALNIMEVSAEGAKIVSPAAKKFTDIETGGNFSNHIGLMPKIYGKNQAEAEKLLFQPEPQYEGFRFIGNW